MSTASIVDTRVRVLPSKELLDLIKKHRDVANEMPENMAQLLKRNGVSLPAKVEIIESTQTSAAKIDFELLANLCGDPQSEEVPPPTTKGTDSFGGEGDTLSTNSTQNYLHLSDLRWLDNFLRKLRKEHGVEVFLHNIIEKCAVEMPQNEIAVRNPELEARCQKLREQQQNREYAKMTKNVDAGLKHFPEDTIAYQMKAINSQIIAVLQFVFSVVAGFVFGFLGIELIIGNLDFGLRLLLGIMFALIIALAEIYFLAKKLNEYDDVADAAARYSGTPIKNKKQHAD